MLNPYGMNFSLLISNRPSSEDTLLHLFKGPL